MLRGLAVFTIDVDTSGNAKTGDNHQGRTTGTDDTEREFDFVQKMINHIVPPLRTPVMESNLENTIDVDGLYGAQTEKIVKGLITGGDVAMSATKTITLTTGLKISHHVDGTNDPKTFRKLARDYTGITDFGENTTELDHPDIGKVIDKEVLVGLVKTDDEMHPTKLDENGNSDIGIYELYFNEHCLEYDANNNCVYSIEDWDKDGISNYIEVENSKLVIGTLQGGSGGDAKQFADPDTNYTGINYSENDGAIPFDPLKPNNITQGDGAGNLLGTTSRGWHHFGELLTSNATNINTSDYSTVNRIDGFRIPNNGKGFYYYKSLEPSDDVDNYATLEVLRRIEAVGNIWAEKHPDLFPLRSNEFQNNGSDNALDKGGSGGIRFGVGDLSRAGGGYFYQFCTPRDIEEDPNCTSRNDFKRFTNGNVAYDHASHKNGIDVDVRYIRKEEAGEGGFNFNVHDVTDYSTNRTKELMRLFVEMGAVEFFVDESGRAKIINDTTATSFEDHEGNVVNAKVTRIEGHSDHFHVRFVNPNLPKTNLTLKTNPENTMSLPADNESSVTIVSNEVVRDAKDWAAMYVPVTVTDNNGEPIGKMIDSECKKINGTRWCKLNAEGKLEFTYQAGIATGIATIRAWNIPGGTVLGTMTIEVLSTSPQP